MFSSKYWEAVRLSQYRGLSPSLPSGLVSLWLPSVISLRTPFLSLANTFVMRFILFIGIAFDQISLQEGEIGGKKNRQCLQMTEVVFGCVMPAAIGMLDCKEMRTLSELCISLG